MEIIKHRFLQALATLLISFLIRTDHSSLRRLLNFKQPKKLAGWIKILG